MIGRLSTLMTRRIFSGGYDPLVYDNANGLRTFTVANGGATNAKTRGTKSLPHLVDCLLLVMLLMTTLFTGLIF